MFCEVVMKKHFLAVNRIKALDIQGVKKEETCLMNCCNKWDKYAIMTIQ